MIRHLFRRLRIIISLVYFLFPLGSHLLIDDSFRNCSFTKNFDSLLPHTFIWRKKKLDSHNILICENIRDLLCLLLDLEDRYFSNISIIELLKALQNSCLKYYHTETPKITFDSHDIAVLKLWWEIGMFQNSRFSMVVWVDGNRITQFCLIILIHDDAPSLHKPMNNALFVQHIQARHDRWESIHQLLFRKISVQVHLWIDFRSASSFDFSLKMRGVELW